MNWLRLKKKTVVLLTLLAAGLLPACGQTSITNDFSFSVMTTVPDGSASGLANNQTFVGMAGTITNVTLGLNLTGGFNGDLYVYLRHGDVFSVLLNRTGVGGTDPYGSADSGFNVTFSLSAADNIHFYQNLAYDLNGDGQLTGAWQPDGRAIDPQSSPSIFDSTSPSATLDLFNGTNPNGTWTLFLADLSNGAQSELIGWNLQITTVPEPPAWALLAMGALWLSWQLRIGKQRRA